MASWLQSVATTDVQAICEGAAKNSNAGVGAEGKKAIENSGTYFNRIYLRKYEPDEIRRYKQTRGLSQSYLDSYLEREPYKGNPEKLFKSLLKPRTRSNER